MRLPAFRDIHRDAVRMGLQAAIAASGFYLLTLIFEMPEVFVGVISSVLVLGRSSDGSLGAGETRMVSTLLGSAIGILCVIVLPYGWGTAVALGLSMFVMNAIAVLRPNWQYGIVAAIALSLGAERDVLQVSLDRLLSIGVGAAVGIFVSFLVWPETANRRYQRHRRAVLDALIDRLERLASVVDSDDAPASQNADQAYHNAFAGLEDAARATALRRIDGAGDELHLFRRIYNSIVILDRAMEEGRPLDPGFRTEIEGMKDGLARLRDGSPPDDTIDRERDRPGARAEGADRVAAFGLQELRLEIGRLHHLHDD